MSGTYSVAIVGGTGRLGKLTYCVSLLQAPFLINPAFIISGYEISVVFLDEFRTTFPIVRVLTRDPSTARAQTLASKGAMLQVLDSTDVAQSLLETFVHADVVINALNVSAPKALKKQVAAAAVASGARVFFLSEFGVYVRYPVKGKGKVGVAHGMGRDHRENDFPGYDHHDWDVKRELAAHAREVARGTPTQVVAVYTGLFIELSLNVRVAGRYSPCTWHTDTEA